MLFEKELKKIISEYDDFLFIRMNEPEILSREMIHHLGVSKEYQPCYMILEGVNNRI